MGLWTTCLLKNERIFGIIGTYILAMHSAQFRFKRERMCGIIKEIKHTFGV
jgi:hypothetical protein